MPLLVMSPNSGGLLRWLGGDKDTTFFDKLYQWGIFFCEISRQRYKK